MNFNLRRVLAVVKIRNKEFYRDFGALGWVIVFPLLMIVVFGYVFNIDSGENYKIGYWDKISPMTIENIKWVKYQDKDEALNKLKYQKIDLVFSELDGQKSVWRAKDSAKSKMALKLLQLSLSNTTLPFEIKNIKGKVYSYLDWVFPGIVNLNVMFMGLWGVGWVIVRQRKLGILKRFKASPLTSFEYLLAQMTSRLIVTSVSGVLVYSLAHVIYPFNYDARYFDLFIVFIIGAMSLSSLGLIFASRINSEELCNGLLNFLTYPLMFISEIWFSLEGSPTWVKSIATYSPLWRMTNSMRKILLEGESLSDRLEDIIFLLAFGLIFTLVGSFLFKWNKN